MEKNLSDYLHLYLWAECLVKYPFAKDKPMILKVNPVNLHEFLNEVEYCKPILRRLQDMTDMEWIELGRMHNPKIDWKFEKGVCFGRENPGITQVLTFMEDCMLFVMETQNNIFGQEKEGETYISNISIPDLYRWLLSKHFDLFGLIPANLAIDKLTIK